jgi:ABC-2 type transport system permease protein
VTANSPIAAGSATGSIYDLGYRGYDGPRLGRSHAVRSLFTHSLQSTYGIGRSGRAKIAPLILGGLMLLPSVAIIIFLVFAARFGGQIGDALSANAPIRYDTMWASISAFVTLFCAAQAPELFGRDQRHGILSVYFARALRRTDYALARILGFAAALLIVLLLAQALLFVGRVLLSPDIVGAFRRDLPSIPPVLGQALLISLLYGGVAMTISAYTPRRAYAVAGIVAVFVIPGLIATVITSLGSSTIGDWLILISPSSILDGTNAVLFGAPLDSDFPFTQLPAAAYLAAAAVVILGSIAICVRRFQRISV